jgi:hypothetical protein
MGSPRQITEDEMLALLDRAFKGDPEQNLVWQLGQKVTDPLKPEDENGRWRIHPLLLAIAALAAIVAGSFVYFGLLHP